VVILLSLLSSSRMESWLKSCEKEIDFSILCNIHIFFYYRTEPSKEMKGALKVLNDYLRKSPITSVPHHLKNATNIVQKEWFKVHKQS
jgi:hypothetical protein